MALAPLILTEKVGNSSRLPPSDVPLHLLLAWPLERARPQWLPIIAGSILLHFVFFFAAIRLPSFIPLEHPTNRVAVRRVPLYLPPKTPISKISDMADLRPTATEQPREARPALSRKHFQMPRTARKISPTLPEAPKLAANLPAGPLPPAVAPGVATGLPPAAAPPPNPSPFQNVGSEAPLNPHPTLTPKLGVQKTSVQAAIQALAPNTNADDSSAPSPRVPGSLGQPAAPHAAVELESDPQGADFKPYLDRILTIVRANWRSVVPEGARTGTLRGRTVMEFIINRDGSIPKIVTADSSGSDPLDRAALAGLSMSNPLPPLPADYKGFQVRLAFTFNYNLPSQ